MPVEEKPAGGAAAAGAGAAAPAVDAGAAPAVAADNSAAAAPAAPAAPASPAAGEAAAAQPAPAAGAADAPKPGADAPKPAGDATPPANEFKPSLLDAAATPPAKDGEAAKPAADAKPGDKPGSGKPAEGAKPAEAGKDGEAAQPPAPIEYAFTFPEGVKAETVNQETMGKFTGVLNEGRMAPELGQKLLDLHLSEVGEVSRKLAQHQWDTFNALQNTWRDAVMAHPVLGGARHQTAIKEIMSVVDHYAGSAEERGELLNVFRTTGVANNPTFLMLLHRVSADLTREAVPHPAPPPRAAAPSREQRGLNRYQKTTPANGAAR